MMPSVSGSAFWLQDLARKFHLLNFSSETLALKLVYCFPHNTFQHFNFVCWEGGEDVLSFTSETTLNILAFT